MVKLNKSSGFTLVELLVVIAIITILATFIIPNVGTGRQRAQQAKCLNNVRTLTTTAIVKSSDMQGNFLGYPSTFSSLFDGRNLDASAADCPSAAGTATVSYGAGDAATVSGGEYTLVTGLTASDAGTEPLVYDTNDNHNGYNVGYLAGNVKFESSAPTPGGTGTSTS